VRHWLPEEEAFAGSIGDLVALAIAVEEQKRTEEALLQAQKMESIGRLAGGVAHDFNNLLTAILGYTELAEASLDVQDEARAYLEPIQHAAERAANLTAQLLAFARKQTIAPRVISLNDHILAVSKLLRRLIGEDIELHTLLQPDLGRVRVDPGQFEQVLVNLAVNARDAMPRGGSLTMETRNVRLDAADAPADPDFLPGDYVLIAVSDTGTGMSETVQQHLFEPFFTTKEAGKGTGLGLSTCSSIIQQAGGYIRVDSEPGHGTTFNIYLPQVAPEAETAVAPTREVPRGSETLLVVEDEEVVREMTVAALRSQGYTVLAAGTGQDALELAQQETGDIPLLVTDVVMPQMSGGQLAEALHAFRPAMRVLYLSGYEEEAIMHHYIQKAGVSFLQKPFTPGALARKVREILDTRE
jgi:nitrogen-specific signal transduction histidine kinase